MEIVQLLMIYIRIILEWRHDQTLTILNTYHLKTPKKINGLLASQVSRSVCHYMPMLITVGGIPCFVISTY